MEHNKTIPKIIHYCWFGGNPLPESAKKCIASWHKFLPDYKVKEWNETNFDVNSIRYTREAYRLKKYAFVSDYARMWILYNYGGLYFDTDVELIKPIYDIITRGNYMGREIQVKRSPKSINNKCISNINPGLGIGAIPGLNLYRNVLDWYQKRHFATWNGKFTKTIVDIVSKEISLLPIKKLGNNILFAGDIYIYPPDFFCPKNYFTGELKITENTRSIHHYSATWIRTQRTILQRLIKRVTYIRARFNI